MKGINRIRMCFVGVALVVAAVAAANGLHIGDKAPLLKTDRWMKGTSVVNFQKGRVYVVEFWATWCGPCRQAMPHLSELSKKYADDVTFIGVDVWEEEHSNPGENLKAKADNFVKQMGDRMTYNVCADSDDGYMAANWLKAASQDGIPATFVIGKDGEIAWIGHPLYVEDPLRLIIAGTFDVKAFAAVMNPKIDKARQTSDAQALVMKPIEEAIKVKNYALAIRECDKALGKSPDIYKYGIAMRKFELLVKYFPNRAYAEAVKAKGDPAQYWMAAEVFSTTSGLSKDCYKCALTYYEQKYKNQPDNPNRFAHFASVYFQLGEYKSALNYFQNYADAVKKMNLDPATLEGVDQQLKRYKEAAARVGG